MSARPAGLWRVAQIVVGSLLAVALLIGGLGALLPRCIDMGNVAWTGGSYGDYSAAISARVRHLWQKGAQVFALGGDHGVTTGFGVSATGAGALAAALILRA